jgi:hypothetical protein
MLIRGVDRPMLEAIASDLKLRLDGATVKRNGVQFKLRHDSTVKIGTRPFQKTSSSYFNRGRRVGAPCWHGFLAFLVKVYKVNSYAYTRSGIAIAGSSDMTTLVYNGVGDFLEKREATGDVEAGPQISPILYRDCCECDQPMIDAAYAGRLP